MRKTYTIQEVIEREMTVDTNEKPSSEDKVKKQPYLCKQRLFRIVHGIGFISMLIFWGMYAYPRERTIY